MTTSAMLQVSLHPYRLTIRESVGLAHEPQVVEVPIPKSSPAFFYLRDESTRQLHPVQTSERKPDHGFLLLSVEPDQTLTLIPARAKSQPEPEASVSVKQKRDIWTVTNGKLSIELSSGKQVFGKNRSERVLGPVRRFRSGNGPWRGGTFFDTLNVPVQETASWLEKGPLRSVYHYRIDFAEGGFYELELTVNASSDFVQFHETFRGAATDQIVWDFAGADLPERINLLDSTAGYTPRWLHYHLDQRHARLWCWTQFSQLHDLSDGFALHFTGSDDAVGLVSLAGGKWKGNALNQLEAWTRRWQNSDPTTRRLPGETKADSFPGVDSIPARGQSVNEPHFTLEGWLRNGERHFALVLSTGATLAPLLEREGANEEKGCSVELGHFENVPQRDLYRRLQGRLRKIHIQHGQLPLQDQLALAFNWPQEKSFTSTSPSLDEARQLALKVSQIHHAPPAEKDPDNIKLIDDFLAARVFGFWEGSGSAYTNCVVSRRVGPDMLHFEALVKERKVGAEQIARWRSWFSFLAHLYHSDNFYPGSSTMEPIGSANSVEPTMAGMSNQNFYTDIITLSAFAAQVFPGHPSAAGWRDKFLVNWHRQLDYHVFPKSGVWEESHTYYQHVLATVLPLFLRRKADGTRDDFADAAFQKMVAGALGQLTPPNAITEGCRHLVTFGDHGADPIRFRYVYRELARAFAPVAPALAENLAWVYREMKGDDLTGIYPLPPALVTGYLEGLGFFFRGSNGAGVESLMALRSGMAWGHHHNDDGSIQFYARGRALIVDSASSQPQERGERKALSAGHSRVTVDGVEPLNHFWRFNRGWILESQVGDLAYAVAGTPTFTALPKNLSPSPLVRTIWEFRAVVELAPAIYLIADYLDASQRHTVRFHVAHQEAALEENRVSASFGIDCRLKILPLFRVASPIFSQDRPVNPAKIPQEITTSMEYPGVTGPWSLFVIAALGPKDQLKISLKDETAHIAMTEKNFRIRSTPKILEVSREGDSALVTLQAESLLAKLRAGSR
jgi:Heparinase II/III-like protein